MATKRSNNFFLYFVVFAVNLISLATGSAYSWTSPVLPILKSPDPDINPLPIAISTFEESWITSLLSLGASIGPFIAGQLVDRIGKKKTLLLFSLPMLTSHIFYAFGTNVYYFLVARFILGIGAGCVYAVVPNYVAEISEDFNRGTLGCIMGLMLAVGTLFSFVIGPFVNMKMFSLLNAIPICLFCIFFGIVCPESPYYLIIINNKKRAEQCLKKLRNKTSSAVKKELLDITKSIEKSRELDSNIVDLLKSRAVIKGLIISMGLMIFQQCSGVTAVIGYMQSIFEATGSSIPPHISVIIIGTIQFISLTVTSQLVDRLGRKILLLISSTGSFLSLITLGGYFFLKSKEFKMDTVSWLPITSLVIFIITFSFGLNPLPWAIMGELFLPNIKPVACAITSFTCLFLAFLISMFFPYMVLTVGIAGCFWIFAGFCGCSILFAQFVVIETKGKSFIEIQTLLNGET